MNDHEENPPAHAFELYKILIEENRHLHDVWIDNFRTLLTFNSILFAGTFALLTYTKSNAPEISDPSTLSWSLRIVSILGTIATTSVFLILRRVGAITQLRLNELKYIECRLANIIPVHPFTEGAVVLGSQGENSCLGNETLKNYEVRSLKWNPIGAFGAQIVVCLPFVVAHVAIFLLSFK